MKNDRMMKHMTLLLTLGLLLWGAQVQAQDWKDALKKVVTSAADEATGGKLTEVAIVGAWRYTGPGIKFEGENLTSQLGGAAIESTVTKQLVKGYELVGIREGACSFDFAGDGTFTAQLGSHELAGLDGQDSAGDHPGPRLSERHGAGAGLPRHEARRAD